MSFKEHGIRHDRSQKLIDHAYEFAKAAHGDQQRKYTFAPYITHPVAVARLVSSVTNDCEMICAALMHDVIEDTPVTFDQIRDEFGLYVADYVMELTDHHSDPAIGNRSVRKAKECERLRGVSENAQTIKLADMIDNSASIAKHDPDFAKVYMAEKFNLLIALKGGHSVLWNQASDIVTNYFTKAGWNGIN